MSNKSETIDLVDLQNKIIGTVDKDTAHRDGLWHRTVSFLVVDSAKKKVYFQDKNKPSELNTNDFFVKMNGGHLLAGESIEDGTRELEEELGVILSPKNVIPIGINQTAIDFSESYKIREFMYYFIADIKNFEDKVKFVDGEVSSVISFNPIDAIDVVLGKKESILGEIYDGDDKTKINLYSTAFKNFTDDNLYLRIFLTLKRYFEGELKEYLVI